MVLINVRSVDGTTLSVTVDSLESTVADVKAAIESDKGYAASTLRLVFRGKVLEDERSLASYCESTCL